ncbi:16S rRNA m(5)C-967 methyltransferase [Candidatus Ruthia magnifica str. Cm (Calyptogena magnifica)]|uniref:16S rRNA (cytosine(967)-C(5))-methyltransferase n=1 Tax=Ruthia magnifica subsp. Calyptogena magnifica TaxID=413404 RepID=A1AVP0_RUTMC|nr:16S rRNA (cytosine(967)-C(5))-methyltransferase RsmB [Candidatus Ruthturnera calyptogenae]ABL01997.1 16S rRNA m(5)C-967 methyltransferase [Candidatus Ruthia magnifica str. Cm (Calyptogena magnifica)]
MANNITRFIALEAIYSVIINKKSLSAFNYPKDNDTPLIKSLVFGTIRFYHQLNDIVSKRLKHSFKKEDLDVHCLMLLGAYQLLYSKIAIHASIFETVNVVNALNKPWAKALVNAILRKIDRDKKILQQQVHYSHPSWLVKKIKRDYPNDFETIFKQNNTQAPMTIRVHTSLNLDHYQQQLQQEGISSQKLAITPQALVLDKATTVFNLVKFEQGACYVQDASAQLSVPLLNPKNTDLILDACSAPGGKATHLCELAPQCKVIALDNDNKRLIKISQNAQRLKITNIQTILGSAQNQDWWDSQLFDKILFDAPCSATGVIRRHPDIKLLRKPKDITTLVVLQKNILENLWQMLKPSGILLYATCSILKVENEQQIKYFLNTHYDAKEIKIELDWGINTTVGRQQLPTDNFDGFYYAKIIKLT